MTGDPRRNRGRCRAFDKIERSRRPPRCTFPTNSSRGDHRPAASGSRAFRWSISVHVPLQYGFARQTNLHGGAGGHHNGPFAEQLSATVCGDEPTTIIPRDHPAQVDWAAPNSETSLHRQGRRGRCGGVEDGGSPGTWIRRDSHRVVAEYRRSWRAVECWRKRRSAAQRYRQRNPGGDRQAALVEVDRGRSQNWYSHVRQLMGGGLES